MRGWLPADGVESYEINTVVFDSGVVHELVVALADNGAERQIPVVLLAEEDDDRIRALHEFDWGPRCSQDDRKQA